MPNQLAKERDRWPFCGVRELPFSRALSAEGVGVAAIRGSAAVNRVAASRSSWRGPLSSRSRVRGALRREGRFPEDYIASPEGHEQVVRFHLAGDLVGADGLEQAIIGSNATALETTGLCELPAYQFNTLSRRFATVQHRLVKHLASQLSNAQAMLLVVGKRSAEERVATFLINLMQRLEARGFSGKEFNLSMTRYDIASYLGLAVETISRAFKTLQTEGLISVRARHIRLNNASKLQVLAGGPPELADCDVFSSTQRCLG